MNLLVRSGGVITVICYCTSGCAQPCPFPPTSLEVKYYSDVEIPKYPLASSLKIISIIWVKVNRWLKSRDILKTTKRIVGWIHHENILNIASYSHTVSINLHMYQVLQELLSASFLDMSVKFWRILYLILRTHHSTNHFLDGSCPDRKRDQTPRKPDGSMCNLLGWACEGGGGDVWQ